MTLRIGTRGSKLAVAQAGWAADLIAQAIGDDVELVQIRSEGDTNRASLASLGGTGVFATALRDALAAGEVDALVHSLKDLPTAQDPRFELVAHPVREDPRDALCGRNGYTLETLPQNARVGTGSPRRRAQLLGARPDLDVVDIRGNIDSRLARIDDDLDAVVLAAAGLLRLGRESAVTEFLDIDAWPTAPGQGALAIEMRRGDERADAVRAVDDAATRLSVDVERAVLAGLEAGCAAPVGAHCYVDSGLAMLHASVYGRDGERVLTASRAAALDGEPNIDWPAVGNDLAQHAVSELMEQGAASLVHTDRSS